MGAVAGVMLGLQVIKGVMDARASRRAYEERAEQQEALARVAYENARRQRDAGFENAQNAAINRENKRRNLMRQLGAQRASVGASGLILSGSAEQALTESKYNMDMELGMDAYNDKQRTGAYFDEAANLSNQGDVNRVNASNYRKAGKRAYLNGLLGTGFTLATGLYGGLSGASKAASAVKSGAGSASLGSFRMMDERGW